MSIIRQVSLANEKAEINAIVNALEAARWNRRRAASILGLPYKALLYKMRKLKLDRASVTSPGGGMAAAG
jgi:DNA-binding NtrC family response regulator